jgi:hypothetical protein
MNFLDAMLGYQNDDPTNTYAVPATEAAAPDAAQTASPSILDLMAKGPPPMPPKPQADTSMLGPLALLQFAAAVAQPRARGQSTTAKILESGAGAASYAMNEKRLMEDRAMQQDQYQRNAQKSEVDLENARMSGLRTRQQITETEQRAPIELDQLKTALATAKTQGEINNIELRIKAISEKYADQEKQAALDERAAKTDNERADAVMKGAHARLFNTQAEEFMNAIKERRQGLKSYVTKEGLPGEPTKVIDQRTGQMYNAPLPPADALDYAERQVTALEKIQPFPDKASRKAAVVAEYQKAIKGNIPMPSADDSSPAQPDAGAAGKPQAPMPVSKYTIQQSVDKPNVVMQDQTTGQYYYGGKPIDEQRAQDLIALANRAAPKAAQPAAAPAPAPAAEPQAPNAAVIPDQTGAYAHERQQLMQQIAALSAAAKTPNLTTQYRIELADQLRALQARLNNFENMAK